MITITDKEYADRCFDEFLKRLKTSALKLIVEMEADYFKFDIDVFFAKWKEKHPYLSPYRHRIRRWVKRKIT